MNTTSTTSRDREPPDADAADVPGPVVVVELLGEVTLTLNLTDVPATDAPLSVGRHDVVALVLRPRADALGCRATSAAARRSPPARRGAAAAGLPPASDAGEDVEQLIADDRRWVRAAGGGTPALVLKRGAAVAGVGRDGLPLALPLPVIDAVSLLNADSCLLYGEVAGRAYVCSDLLERDGRDRRPDAYGDRFAELVDLVDPVPSDHLRFAETAAGPRAKRELLARLGPPSSGRVVVVTPATAGPEEALPEALPAAT